MGCYYRAEEGRDCVARYLFLGVWSGGPARHRRGRGRCPAGEAPPSATARWVRDKRDATADGSEEDKEFAKFVQQQLAKRQTLRDHGPAGGGGGGGPAGRRCRCRCSR